MLRLRVEGLGETNSGELHVWLVDGGLKLLHP